MKFELYRDAKGEYRWRLKASDGRYLAAGGAGFQGKAGAREGIDAVKRDAPTAPIVDHTGEPSAADLTCTHHCHRDDHDQWADWCDECEPQHLANPFNLIRQESQLLWTDLADAQRHALNGSWSMACDNLVARIQNHARHVGAVPWRHISVSTLRSRLYERVYQEAKVEYPPIDWDRISDVEAHIAARLNP